MLKILCFTLGISFFLNAILHFLLILGYPLGEYVLGGKHKVLPSKMKFISLFLSLLWTSIGMTYFAYGHIAIIDFFSRGSQRYLIIITTIFLFFATFSNAFLTESKKERIVMTPFCFIAFILNGIILFI